jgi:hypothetical protein
MEEQAPLAPTISFSDIIVNVYASPSEAFEGIRTSPARASVWVVPLLITLLLTCCFTWLMFTNEAIKSQILDSQRARMEQQVQAGKMTQEQADQASAQMEKSGGMMMAFGIVAGVVTVTIMFFVVALLFWLVGKFGLKAPEGYGKYLELYGAATWIGILGFIVMILLAAAYSSMYASPSGALAVLSTYSPKNTMHRFLSSLNVFTIWQMVVIGIGLAKYSGKSSGTGVGVGLGLWVVWVLISVFAMGALGLG